MTPLEARIRDMIAREGPMPVERYMDICLADPEHGYYRNRDPFGGSGDFVTAPEISQIFGELLGLWSAAVWDQIGRPSHLRLIELGPGRGTLMADALRAARVLPPFLAAVEVHLVETSPTLREVQKTALGPAGAAVSWHERLADVPEGPAVIIGNEFLDALPIRQFVRTNTGWHERTVDLRDDRLAFSTGAEVADEMVPASLRGSAVGTIYEHLDLGQAEVRSVAERLTTQGGAALFIDYGFTGPAAGDTLQAVRDHRYADVLAMSGDADLTAHVDFRQMANAAAAAGAAAYGPITQRDLLLRLGAEARLAKLKSAARPDQTEAVETGYRRITAQGHRSMGDLFKALAVAAPDMPPPPAFSDEELFRS